MGVRGKETKDNEDNSVRNFASTGRFYFVSKGPRMAKERSRAKQSKLQRASRAPPGPSGPGSLIRVAKVMLPTVQNGCMPKLPMNILSNRKRKQKRVRRPLPRPEQYVDVLGTGRLLVLHTYNPKSMVVCTSRGLLWSF